jgi:hypothetical protein
MIITSSYEVDFHVSSTLQMEASGSSETVAPEYKPKDHHVVMFEIQREGGDRRMEKSA